jgi:Ca2+:H+ antiporter
MTAAVMASFITNGGRSTWFIGALLLFVYAIFAMTLYVVPPAGEGPG